MPKSKQKGFTLIELIIVVAILGVLSAITIPQYYNYQKRTERAAVIADCNSLYRGFIVYFIEQGQYPAATAGTGPVEYLFNPVNFRPLTNPDVMGVDLQLELNVERLLTRVDFEAFDSPDEPLGTNQEFYLVLKWKIDPTVRFLVSQSFATEYAGTVVDGGNWLDGVYMSKDWKIVQ